jgi:hypothetical protein
MTNVLYENSQFLIWQKEDAQAFYVDVKTSDGLMATHSWSAAVSLPELVFRYHNECKREF